MATPAKTTAKPAQSTAPAAPTAPAESKDSKPAFSLDAVQPVKVAAPKRQGSPTAGRKPRDNSQVEGWLANLWQNRPQGQNTSDGLQIQVPAFAVPEMRSRLLDAAEKLEIGVSIRPTAKELKDAKYAENDMVDVVFAVKPRKTNRKVSDATVKAVTGKTPEQQDREYLGNVASKQAQ